MLDVLRGVCPRLPENSWAPLKQPLFQKLRTLGREAGFKVWDGATTGEYLWDVAWTYEPDDPDRYWLELAAEIELSDMSFESTRDDFYKVLDAKARLKLFVCCMSQKMAKDLCDEIDWVVPRQRLRLQEERLAVVILTYSERGGLFTAHTRLYDGSGSLTDWEYPNVACVP